MFQHRGAGRLAFLSALALAACGGGSGGGGMSVTFIPSKATDSVFEDETDGHLVQAGALLSPVPTEYAYLYLSDPGGTFREGEIDWTYEGSGFFEASAPLNGGLAPGDHSGSVALAFCKVSDCTQSYGTFPLPYRITVMPVIQGLDPLTAVIEIGGAAATDVNEGLSNGVRTYSIRAALGQVIEITPSQPFVQVRYTAQSTNLFVDLAATQGGGLTATTDLLAHVDSGDGNIVGRAADGRTISVQLQVDRP